MQKLIKAATNLEDKEKKDELVTYHYQSHEKAIHDLE